MFFFGVLGVNFRIIRIFEVFFHLFEEYVSLRLGLILGIFVGQLNDGLIMS